MKVISGHFATGRDQCFSYEEMSTISMHKKLGKEKEVVENSVWWYSLSEGLGTDENM